MKKISDIRSVRTIILRSSAAILSIILAIGALSGCGISFDNDLYDSTYTETTFTEKYTGTAITEDTDVSGTSDTETVSSGETTQFVSLDDIPEWDGSDASVEINGDVPFFTDDEKDDTDAFETYSNLDSLGRCGVAYANVCTEIMPTEERGEIGSVKPSGWHTVRYDDIISDKYLYNRCHLIAYMLAGENANVKNLITGTRYLNITGMLPYENSVDDYVEDTDNHVLYRVTPIFDGDDLVASGVLMEAYSVEDDGSGIEFCVYCYNEQPGITIDHLTGDSVAGSSVSADTDSSDSDDEVASYVLNTTTKKIHLPSCSSVSKMSDSNKKAVSDSISDLESQGYTKCKICLG